MSLTREQLWDQLQRRELEPIYVLHGVETYLRDLAAKKIVETCFNEGDFRDFNDDAFSLNTPDNIRTALAAANQLPMMAARRVVKVTEVRVSTSAQKDTLKEDYFDALAGYLKNPSPTSVVIFVADELNGNRKVGKLLKEQSGVVEFGTLDGASLLKWARQELRKNDAEMDERTIRHLIGMIGPDVRRLTIEIAKLATSALPGKTIGMDLVDDLVMNASVNENFALSNALTTGDPARLLRTLKKDLDNGGEPIALLGLLSFHYRRMLIAKDLMESGADRQTVTKSAKVFGNAESFLAAARRTSKKQLEHAVIRVAETDAAIKTSVGGSAPKGPRMLLETLLCELAGN
jgi:DNA polymerase-3 subunit delta